MEAINVLSLFDGMSCGQQALERAGININKYYASEIDKYAMKVTMANYPNTIQLGSVIDIDAKKLDKIDLLIGGSPCQSFSFAGKRKGMSTKDSIEILTLDHYLKLKSEQYEFEGQSYLFWEYMRILTYIRKVNPDVKFLLENVMMGEKWEKILTKAIGVKPIMINSALVSAQNRKRLYWTNIGMEPDGLFGDLKSIIKQPADKKIFLKDIIENDVDEKYFLSDKVLKFIMSENRIEKKHSQIDGQKGITMTARQYASWNGNHITVHNMMPRSSTTGKGGTGHLSRKDGKTYCLDTGNTNAVEIVAMRGRNPENPKDRTAGLPTEQMLEKRGDGKTNCLPTVQKDNLVSNTKRIRRLTPTEFERLQTVKEGHTSHVSDSQRYKMLGNGWTVDVIAHIFSYIQ